MNVLKERIRLLQRTRIYELIWHRTPPFISRTWRATVGVWQEGAVRAFKNLRLVISFVKARSVPTEAGTEAAGIAEHRLHPFYVFSLPIRQVALKRRRTLEHRAHIADGAHVPVSDIIIIVEIYCALEHRVHVHHGFDVFENIAIEPGRTGEHFTHVGAA